MRKFHLSVTGLVLLGMLIAGGCVSYDEKPVEWAAVSASVAERHPGTLTFEGALVYARAHNPELKRLRAEAQAAGLDVPPTYVNLSGNSAESKALGFVDPVALFKLGPRGARARANRLSAIRTECPQERASHDLHHPAPLHRAARRK